MKERTWARAGHRVKNVHHSHTYLPADEVISLSLTFNGQCAFCLHQGILNFLRLFPRAVALEFLQNAYIKILLNKLSVLSHRSLINPSASLCARHLFLCIIKDPAKTQMLEEVSLAGKICGICFVLICPLSHSANMSCVSAFYSRQVH